ncbi:hypothetical protein PCE1_004711 [Barthelona sp. PCE]
MSKEVSSDITIRLRELRKRYKMLEMDRKSYVDKVAADLRNQKVIIERLKREKANLEDSLAAEEPEEQISGRTSRTSKFNSLQDRLQVILNSQESLSKKKVNIDKKIVEYKGFIKTLDFQLKDERTKLGQLIANKKDDDAILRQIEILESRLNKATIKFNSALTQNRTMREDIDSLRRERVVYDDVYSNLERKLQSIESVMADIIQDSNESYDLRAQYQQQLQELKTDTEKETQQFDTEWKELNRLIEQDRRLREVLQMKVDSDSEDEGDGSVEKKRAVNKHRPKGSPHLGQQFAEERITNYEQAFERIKEATGVRDVEDLVIKFIQSEDKNFSLFNHLNDINSQIEGLQNRIGEKKDEIEELLSKQNEKESESSNAIQKLTTEINEKDRRVVDYQRDISRARKELDYVINDLKIYLEKVCDYKCQQNANPAFRQQIRVSYHLDENITTDSVLKIFGVLEHDLNDLLLRVSTNGLSEGNVHHPSHVRERDRDSRSGFRTTSSTPYHQMHPTSANLDDDKTVDDRPLTRVELRERAMRNRH